MPPQRHKPAVPMPLVPVALLLAAGIAIGHYAPVPLGVWVLLLAGATASMVAFLAWPTLTASRLLAAAAILAGGACLGLLTFERIAQDHIAGAIGHDGWPLATVTGRIASTPEIRDDQRQFAPYDQPPQTVFLLDSDGVTTSAGPQACTGRLRVRVQAPAPLLRAGQRVRLAGKLYRPGEPDNPGGYDARRAARLDGVLAGFSAEAAEAVEILDDAPDAAHRLLQSARIRARQKLGIGGDWNNRLLLRTLLLGDRCAELNDLQQSMTRSGLAHYLSISGQHLGILLGFMYLLLRVARLTPRQSAGAVLVLLTAYLLLVDTHTPLLRAGIMAAAICAAVLTGRLAVAANLLALAAIGLLVWDPREMFRPAFQLSFGTVAGLIIFHRPVKNLLFGRWLQTRGLRVYHDKQRLRRWLSHRGADAVISTVSLSVAANLAAVPLAAYHFGLMAPLAALWTILLMPVVALTLVTGYVQLVLSWLTPNLSGLLGGPAAWLAGAFAAQARAAQALPFTTFDLQPVTTWATALVIIGLLAGANRRRLRLTRATAILVMLTTAAAAWAGTQYLARPPLSAELAMLDVGNGQCAVLRTPAGQTVLLDAGSINRVDPHSYMLRPFLRQRRWPQPCAVVVSHANADHYNALPGLLSRHSPRHAYVSDVFGTSHAALGPRELLKELSSAGTSIHRLNRGQTVRLDDCTTITALWPPRLDQGFGFEDVNDTSLVLRLECKGFRVLVPGDATELSQQLLLELPHEELRADVLVLPHHGAYTPSLKAFVAAVNPSVLVRSSGPRQGEASRQIPELAKGRQFHTTDREGCITIALSPDGPHVTAFGGR